MTIDLFKEVNSEWVAPSEYPDLSTHNIIAVDLETCDPELVKEVRVVTSYRISFHERKKGCGCRPGDM